MYSDRPGLGQAGDLRLVGFDEDRGVLLGSLNKVGKAGESLSDQAIWAVVTEGAKRIDV